MWNARLDPSARKGSRAAMSAPSVSREVDLVSTASGLCRTFLGARGAKDMEAKTLPRLRLHAFWPSLVVFDVLMISR